MKQVGDPEHVLVIVALALALFALMFTLHRAGISCGFLGDNVGIACV